jgi:U3 small nucleolar RNA-associated protein 15
LHTIFANEHIVYCHLFAQIWDLLAGGRLLHSFSNHQKAITCLAFDGEGKRLLSGSIDHHVKIYNVTNYKVCCADDVR